MPRCRVCRLEKDKKIMMEIEHRKYICKECEDEYNEFGETKTDRELLTDYINTLYNNPNWTLITVQIEQLEKDYNMKCKGMELTLRYYLELEGKQFDETYGFKWIMEKYYEETKRFYMGILERKIDVEEVKQEEVIYIKPNINKLNLDRFKAKIRGVDE